MITAKLKPIIFFLNIIAVYGTNAGHPGTILNRGSCIVSDIGFPANKNSSIQYHLYTPKHPNELCYFEPDVSNSCQFNTSYDFKILIHGFTVQLLPGNFFEQIKDTLLEYNKYNVIIVNWTKYDGKDIEEYPIEVALVYPVAIEISIMVNFLLTKGVNPLDVHIIGHSLGAHIAGVAGKLVPNLGRVTGLDPAGPFFFECIKFNRLTYNSAILVDVIHTSNYLTGIGLGYPYAMGSVDFYPNGGHKQPACQMGGQYYNGDAELITITSDWQLAFCYHDMALVYFLNSIHLCNYHSLECESYEKYSAGGCNVNSNLTNKMGLLCEQIPGLPIESGFYLNTSANQPYCEMNLKHKIPLSKTEFTSSSSSCVTDGFGFVENDSSCLNINNEVSHQKV